MNTKNENLTKESKDFSDRLRYLRNKKELSAREMSIALGQNVNYINLIENGKRFPSLQGFFAICEYLEISASDFFDSKTFSSKHIKNSKSIETEKKELISFLETLSAEQISSIINTINTFKNKC